jgi:hypothetical protein
VAQNDFGAIAPPRFSQSLNNLRLSDARLTPLNPTYDMHRPTLVGFRPTAASDSLKTLPRRPISRIQVGRFLDNQAGVARFLE